ncbi:MAG TPA: hypothetical protein DCR94_02455 [Firmicutes bacterium]|nr:hypothetical protein [Bacillota bacterium]
MISKELNKYIHTLSKIESKGEERDYHANLLFSINPKQFSKAIKENIVKEENLSPCLDKTLVSLMNLDKESEQYINSLPKIHLEEVNKNLLLLNPYYQKLMNLKPIENNSISFCIDYFYPFVPFLLDEKVVTSSFEEYSPFGYFKEKIGYPVLKKDGSNWMELVPHELNSMKEDIEKACGNVLIFGLGLGYFAYMVSIKKEVKEITIIEKDKEIIALFKEHLFNEFENKEKIKIIEGDALTFSNFSSFDFVYIDIYRDELDGLPLLGKMLNNKNLPNDAHFWFISSMLVYLRRFVIVSFELASSPTFKEKEYFDYIKTIKGSCEADRIVYKSYLYFIKSKEYQTAKDIQKALSNDSLLEFAKYLFK